MTSFLLAASLPALFTLGCGTGSAYPPLPEFDAPKPVVAKVTPQGKKVTKPPISAARSPVRPPG